MRPGTTTLACDRTEASLELAAALYQMAAKSASAGKQVITLPADAAGVGTDTSDSLASDTVFEGTLVKIVSAPAPVA